MTDSTHLPAVPEKPLNQAQVKNLTAIITGDLDSLKESMWSDIDRRLRQRIAQIDDEFGTIEGWQQMYTEWSDLCNDFESQIEGLMAKTRNRGFDPTEIPVKVSIIRRDPSFWAKRGGDDARYKANQAANQMKQLVTNIIGRERRKIERAILIQSLPGGPSALEIVNDLPDTDDLMELVRAEIATKDADILAELLID